MNIYYWSTSKLRWWLLAILIPIGILAIWAYRTHAPLPEFQLDQIIVDQMGRDIAPHVEDGDTVLEGAILVKVKSKLKEEPYYWSTQSPLAIWRFASGAFLPATLEELDRAEREADVYRMYFSIQSATASRISIDFAAFYPVIAGPGYTGGGYGFNWQLTDDGSGWQIATRTDTEDWGSVSQ